MSKPSSAGFVRIDRSPYAWILRDGQVLAWNLSEEDIETLVEEASILINYPNYIMVTNHRVFCDSEDLTERVFVIEGADPEVLEMERVRLEVEKFYSWSQPLYQVYL